MSRKQGVLITFEGTEGSGKTTQIKLLSQRLKRDGYDVLNTREPGGTELGLVLRKILLKGKQPLTHATETLLYMASRAALVQEVLKPALKLGRVVICDRWLDATVAYQGYGLGVPVKWINQVASQAVDGLKPNLTLFLDLPVLTGLQRAKKRGALDRIEKRSIDFHNKVRKGYLALAKQHKRIQTVRVTSIEQTQTEIEKHVYSHLS